MSAMAQAWGSKAASLGAGRTQIRRQAAAQPSRQRPAGRRRLVPAAGAGAAARSGTPLGWRAVAAVFLASLQLAIGAPALADTSSFTVERLPASAEEAEEEQYFQTVPQDLDASTDDPKGPRLGSLIEGPKGKQVQQCTRKCVPTCIRGGQGAPGLGPMSMRKELVVFKEGYRTRQYCLSECTQVCALEINGPGALKEGK